MSPKALVLILWAASFAAGPATLAEERASTHSPRARAAQAKLSALFAEVGLAVRNWGHDPAALVEALPAFVAQEGERFSTTSLAAGTYRIKARYYAWEPSGLRTDVAYDPPRRWSTAGRPTTKTCSPSRWPIRFARGDGTVLSNHGRNIPMTRRTGRTRTMVLLGFGALLLPGAEASPVRRSARPVPDSFIVVQKAEETRLSSDLVSREPSAAEVADDLAHRTRDGRITRVFEHALRGFALRATAAEATLAPWPTIGATGISSTLRTGPATRSSRTTSR